ncbi:hypothetical protein LTR37_018388 [Vermiconidia calcicola]|uniref:Uncharacterized protein n=1 Tax=Vermiconidia calcicola TaxID=1690605 RepID=A0ACC3MIP9_9PEZI|nr:hypothetical protein LTR37_018388 [Vermiconidia calcicola]
MEPRRDSAREAATNGTPSANASLATLSTREHDEAGSHEQRSETPNTPDTPADGDRPWTKSSPSSPNGRSNRGGGRSTSSSKFANLRATFEQTPSIEAVKKRRPPSNGKAHDKSSERTREHDAEIARLKDELEKERELRIAFEEKITNLEEEMEGSVHAMEEKDGVWKAESERRSAQTDSEAEQRLIAAENEAKSRQAEVMILQQQLANLKRDVSASTRTSPQVSDTTFAQEMGMLQYDVQNWVVNSFRRAMVYDPGNELCEKLEKVAEPKQLKQLRPMYKAFNPSFRLPIYQATVACCLMEVFDDPYIFGLQEQRDWGKRSRQAADTLHSILDPGTYHRWRTITFEAVRQSEGIKKPVDKAATGIAGMICVILKVMTDVDDSDVRMSSLKTIVQRAISLAHLIRVQQSQYEFILPLAGATFDATSMDDISDVGESENIRRIRCATFPALIKIGDEDGKVLEPATIIVKAKVLCNNGET